MEIVQLIVMTLIVGFIGYNAIKAFNEDYKKHCDLNKC